MKNLPTFSQETATSLAPAQIERALSSMWKPANEGEGPSVTRVVLGNILWLGTSDRFERAKSILQKVITRFPARLFLCEYDESNTLGEITAAVSAECFLPTPGGIPTCCEFIHLQLGPNSARHLRGVIAPLLLTDVQTVLWTMLGETQFPALRDLQQHVDRTIRMAPVAEDPVPVIEAELAATHPTFDLSWFRMTPIRQQVIAFFDDPQNHFDLQSIRHVRITLGRRCGKGSLPEVMAAMFVGWIGSRLGWRERALTADGVLFEKEAESPILVSEATGEGSDGRCALYNYIELADSEGGTLRISIDKEHMDFVCREGKVDTAERHLHLGELDENDALGTALTDPAVARRFRDAATLALPILRYLRDKKRHS